MLQARSQVFTDVFMYVLGGGEGVWGVGDCTDMCVCLLAREGLAVRY